MKNIQNGNIKFRIGDIEIISLNDAAVNLNACEMFPSVSKSDWEKYYSIYPEAFNGKSYWKGRISCNFIKTPDKLILIDTGVGPGSNAFAKFIDADGRLPQQMQREKIDPADVDIVFMTHLHGDHVGWNTYAENQQPLFPNAQYLASKSDWDFCQYRLKNEPEKTGYIYENIFPLLKQNRLEFVDDYITLTKDVSAFSTPGHTPGHMSLKIEDDSGQKLWLLGDAIAHPLQITDPIYQYIFDHDPKLAMETRNNILEKIDKEGGIIGACHFPQPGFGSSIYKQGKRYWQPID